MSIRITYFEDERGEWRVRISGANGEPMFASEGYNDRESARHAISVLRSSFATGEFVILEEEPSENPKDFSEIGEGDVASLSSVLGEEKESER